MYIKMSVYVSTTKVLKFCFTLNNYTDEEYATCCDFAKEKCKFAVIGREVGDNGTPHLQGYMNMKSQIRFSGIKKVIPRAHIEKAQGSDQENLEYCTKEDDVPFIYGEPQTHGKRNDLVSVCNDIVNEKKTLSEVAKTYPEVFVKYSRGIERLSLLTYKPRDSNNPPTVMWLFGCAGAGKTRYAYDRFTQDQVYMKDSTHWWDGYTQQQCILIDDYDGKWPFRDLLRLLDRYPYRGQFKGGYIDINSPFIIVTCEHSPSYFWSDSDLDQITRRLTEVIEFTKK